MNQKDYGFIRRMRLATSNLPYESQTLSIHQDKSVVMCSVGRIFVLCSDSQKTLVELLKSPSQDQSMVMQ